MIDPDKVLALLHKRFPGATPEEIEAAASAIAFQGEDWEELPVERVETADGPGQEPAGVEEFRVFKRRVRGAEDRNG